MKVILLQELQGKGGEGDVVEVARGFANNFLFRKGVAIPATKGNLKQLEQRKHNIAKREEKRLEDAHALQEQLSNATVRVTAQVGEEGVLFGSVTAPMIADALEEMGIEIDRRRIELGKPIKIAGEHTVGVSIYRDIKAQVNVIVAGAEKEKEPEDPAPEDANSAQVPTDDTDEKSLEDAVDADKEEAKASEEAVEEAVEETIEEDAHIDDAEQTAETAADVEGDTIADTSAQDTSAE